MYKVLRGIVAGTSGLQQLFPALLGVLALLPSQAQSANVDVSIAGIQSSKGRVLCRLFTAESRFPREGEVQSLAVPITAGASVCTFVGVPAGTYAVAIAHDTNDNGRLDQNFLGLPLEGFGFSRNVKPRFGPPRFSKAAIPVPQTGATISLTMQYR